MHRWAAVGIVVFVLVATLSVGAVAGTVETGQGTDHEPTASSSIAQLDRSHATLASGGSQSIEDELERASRIQSSQEFDRTHFEITVFEDGSAEWTFHHERLLNGTDDRANFREFADEFESEELELYDSFVQQAEALTDTGSEETDREMTAESFNRTADIEYVPDPAGVVEMSFTWTNFATVDEEDGTITVSDVFDGGLYISSKQILNVYPGDGLQISHTQPPAKYAGQSPEMSDFVWWVGERDFPDNQPRIVFEPTNSSTDSSADESNWLLVGGLVVVLGLGVTAAFVWYRFGDQGSTLPGTSPDDGPTGAAGTAAAGGAQAVGERDDQSDANPIPDEELMTDEDRVVTLIQQNGGRMKQVNIVDETGWSKSKVSMLLSEMEDDGTISKLRVGRENIISLEGFEPEATKSPFEE